MRHRRVTAVLSLVLAALALGGGAFLLTADLGRYHSGIEALASAALGRELRVEGDLSLRLGRSIRVAASDLVLADARWADTPEMLRVGSLTAAVDAWSLVRGPVRIEALAAEQVTARIEVREDGESNLPPLLAGGNGRGLAGPPLLAPQVRVRDATVVVLHPTLTGALEVGVQALDHRREGARVLTRVDGVVNGVPLSVESELGPRGDSRTAEAIRFALEGRLGEVGLAGTGQLDSIRPPRRPSLDLRLEGPSAQYLLESLELPEVTRGPLDVAVRIAATDGRIEGEAAGRFGALDIQLQGRLTGGLLVAEGSVGDVEGRVSLPLPLGGSRAGGRLAFEASGPDAGDLPGAGRLASLSGVPFDLRGEARVLDAALQLYGTQVRLGELRADVEGTMPFGPGGGRLDLALVAEAPSLADLLSRAGVRHGAALPVRASGRLSRERTVWELEDVKVQVGDARASLAGSLGGTLAGSGTKVSVSLEGPDLVALLPGLEGVVDPGVGYRLQGRLAGKGGVLRGRNLSIGFGESRLAANVEVTPGEVPDIDLHLVSPRLDLRPFQPRRPPAADVALAKEPDREDPEPGDPEPSAESGENAEPLVPAWPITGELLARANARVDLSVAEIVTRDLAASNLRLRGALEDGALRLDQLSVAGKRGRLRGALQAVPAGDQGYAVELWLAGEGLVAAPPGEPAAVSKARPPFDLVVEVAGRGRNLRELAAALDGRVRAHWGSGAVPAPAARVVNFFMGDLTVALLRAINPLATQDPVLDVQCAAVILDFEEGVGAGEPAFVLQTPELNVIGDAELDLGAERIVAYFSAQARRGLGISLGDLNPFTKLEGPLTAPRVSLSSKKAFLEGGAAIATQGLSILLKSVINRALTAKDPCAAALEKADPAPAEPQRE